MNWKAGLMVLTLGAFICSPLFSGTASAAEKKVKKQTSVAKSAKTRGEADENIKHKSDQNDPNAKIEAPAKKGGKTRGGYCDLTVDNWTPWKIQVYVEGDYVGLVSSYGKADGFYSRGPLVVYGVAEFDDGSRKSWGPEAIYCDDNFTWKLSR
ncbi:hypothetical protein M1B72_10970 [Geomonas paludis]|uniref:Lipoprotein n=1 Tax=Geomonas paludis TaxID=2740185 RepID=A0A6V8MTQ2_9BACT|nr:hypothetical protein [Geomonas paludis]UPU38204.1 hypothetical protein M1B72_10970 [Geomonas paludis]GFO63264.1 hypothetical protein GMPD_11830 [Geomonas paludis]